MKITYQCENCGEKFEGKANEEYAENHENNCQAHKYVGGEKVEVLYDDGNAPRWLRGTVATNFKSIGGVLYLVINTDDFIHGLHFICVPSLFAPSISKNVRRLAQVVKYVVKMEGKCGYCGSDGGQLEFLITGYDPRKDDFTYGKTYVCQSEGCQARLKRYRGSIAASRLPELTDAPSFIREQK